MIGAMLPSAIQDEKVVVIYLFAASVSILSLATHISA
jgi:hypothetical protein